jgi:hypothetical protein
MKTAKEPALHSLRSVRLRPARWFQALLISSVVGAMSCVSQMNIPQGEYQELDAAEPLITMQFTFKDLLSERRIELSLTNNLRDGVCLLPQFWPNQGGVIGQSPWPPVLLVNGQRFPIEIDDPGYCPGCAQFVAPGETVYAYLSYKQFHLPDELASAEKQCEFTPKAFRCKRTTDQGTKSK